MQCMRPTILGFRSRITCTRSSSTSQCGLDLLYSRHDIRVKRQCGCSRWLGLRELGLHDRAWHRATRVRARARGANYGTIVALPAPFLLGRRSSSRSRSF